MNPYDVGMLIVIVVTTASGARRGMAWQLASLGSIVVSYFVAWRFRELLAPLIDAPRPWNVFAAMLLLYLATSLAIWLGFQLVSGLIDRVRLREFDRQAGAVFGALKGAALCLVITLFAVALLGPDQRRAIIDSHSGFCIASLLNRAHGVMPDEMHDVLHPYMHGLDERLDAAERRAERHHY